jgi:hypothetical protein
MQSTEYLQIHSYTSPKQNTGKVMSANREKELSTSLNKKEDI